MKCQPAFNLLEIILSVGLVLILADISFSVGTYFYQKNCLDNSVGQLKSAITLVRNKSRGQENDDAWGIFAEKDRFVIFQGSDYPGLGLDNNYSEQFYCRTDVRPSPRGPIFFNKQDGFPDKETTFYFVKGKLQTSFSINNYGIISQ